MTDQRSKTERKAYKKAVSTVFYVVENYPASLKTNADESNTSAGVGASTAIILCLVDSRFDSYTGEP